MRSAPTFIRPREKSPRLKLQPFSFPLTLYNGRAFIFLSKIFLHCSERQRENVLSHVPQPPLFYYRTQKHPKQTLNLSQTVRNPKPLTETFTHRAMWARLHPCRQGGLCVGRRSAHSELLKVTSCHSKGWLGILCLCHPGKYVFHHKYITNGSTIRM